MKCIAGLSVIAIVMGWMLAATITAATVTIDQTSLKFLPAGTQALAMIDVAALRNAPLVQDAMKDNLPLPPDLQQVVTGSGVDPKKDIDTITFAKLGPNDGFFVVQGRIDKSKVRQYLTQQGKPSEAYLGQTLYEDHDGAVALVDNTILVGQADAVKKAIDQMQIPGSSGLRSDLMAAVQTIDAGNQVWAVGNISMTDLPAAGVRGPAPVVDMLKSLQSGTYQMHVDTGVHARATANFADTDSARNLHDLATGTLALVKLQVAKQQPDMIHALDGIQVSNNGTTLVVQIDEPGELLKKLTGGLNQLKGQIR